MGVHDHRHASDTPYRKQVSEGLFALQFQSRLALVDRAVVDILAFLGACDFPTYDAFETEVVLREGLTNAVVHGNREDAEKEVTFEAKVTGLQLTLIFADEGAGFDWRKKLAVDEVDAFATCGRGILLMRSYGYDLTGNERGNRIELRRTFPAEKENG